ncbi:MAG: chromosome segregation protein SMC, partial [Eubacterium sp.]|nr:chromosome segregation protein SMC [Eubacterium sp.]
VMKKKRYGRATFLPLTTITPKKEEAFRGDLLKEPGVMGKLSNHVKRESKFDKVVEFLLGRYLLVDTMDHATAIGKKYHYTVRMVTLEGELINPGGSISGGAFKNNSNLLGRKREQEKLEEEMKKYTKDLDSFEDKIKKADELVTKLVGQANEMATKRQELEIKKNTAEIEYDHAKANRDQKNAEFQQIAREGQEIEQQKQLLEKDLQSVEERIAAENEKKTQAEQMIDKLSDELVKDRQMQTELQAKLEDVRLILAGAQQKINNFNENIQRVEKEVEDISEEYKQVLSEQENSDETIEQMERELDGFSKKIQEMKKESEELAKELEDDRKKKDEMTASQKDFFDERTKLTDHIGNLDKEIFRLDTQKDKLEEKLQSKIDYMWNEYELTHRNCMEFDIDESISYTRMKANVGEIKNKIRGLGDVNVNAIEEYKNVSERYELLKNQHDDLIESEEALKKIIEELDEEMRKQFTEKFADIQKQFDKVFKELFGGGKGTIELVEEEDVLEAGITINAQPPGKKLGNMMQLSGGEKALTAISLLFAIQNLKPSPFCLLDEIEAALDDSNVKRYAKYLHKLTKHTQFIVITHRKGTMEAADVLYGITMQEKGVSTLVSVNLIEEQLDD